MRRWSRLFPQFAGLHVEGVLLTPEAVHITVRRAATSARCPSCGRRGRRVHSRSTRQVGDEPVGGCPGQIQLRVRRFRGGARACPRRTFAEPAPQLAARRARRPVPLVRFVQEVGLTLGGRPGARFAARRPIAASRTTLIRLGRALPEAPASAPRVLGVDAFALRRGPRYGTVLVDVAARELVDLLPDRAAASLTSWLGQRAPLAFIGRDRGGEDASGARQGAPAAVQIADRFQLACTSSQALERGRQRHGAAVRAGVHAEVEAAPPAAGTPAREHAHAAEPLGGPAQPKRARRLARYEAVVALHQQGHSLTAIAAQVGLRRPTVRTDLHAGRVPEGAPRRTRLSPGPVHGEPLRVRWREGGQAATVLWRDLRAGGYRGSVRTVQHAINPWRDGPAVRGRPAHRLTRPPTAPRWDHRPPSPTQAVWVLLQPLAPLTAMQQERRCRLLAAAPEIRQALTELTVFRRLIHERDAPALEPWLTVAEARAVRDVRALAAGVRRDHAAGPAALAYAWSSGRVEGQVTKIKLVKRKLYGRGTFDLLKRRVMRAS